jgi:hypothetical protein
VIKHTRDITAQEIVSPVGQTPGRALSITRHDDVDMMSFTHDDVDMMSY